MLPNGKLTYARHPHDLGTAAISALDISNRINDEVRSEVVLEALTEVEERLVPLWPFAPGSSSWIHLEILDPSIRLRGQINSSSVVVRRAVRISSLNKSNPISSSPLIERMFKEFRNNIPESIGRFKVLFSPAIKLPNNAGSGTLTEGLSMIAEGSTVYDTAEVFSKSIIRSISIIDPSLHPGLYVKVLGEDYRIVSNDYLTKAPSQEQEKAQAQKTTLPLIPGILK
tara:strand:- start:1906 stop:2586 length:681 start_codon:yes stop_codon:yes gene_type:complete